MNTKWTEFATFFYVEESGGERVFESNGCTEDFKNVQYRHSFSATPKGKY